MTVVAELQVERAGQLRSDSERELHKAQALQMHARGLSQKVIADRLGISQQAVSKDLKEIWEEIRSQSQEDYETLKAQRLAKLSEVQNQAWEQWERSKRPKQKKTETNQTGGKGGGFTREQEEKQGRLGDPRYLAIINRCIEQECDLLGLTEKRPPAIQVNVFDSLANAPAGDPVADRMKALLASHEALPDRSASQAGEVIYLEAKPAGESVGGWETGKVMFPTLSAILPVGGQETGTGEAEKAVSGT